jgi:hypothetical protein
MSRVDESRRRDAIAKTAAQVQAAAQKNGGQMSTTDARKRVIDIVNRREARDANNNR